MRIKLTTNLVLTFVKEKHFQLLLRGFWMKIQLYVYESFMNEC